MKLAIITLNFIINRYRSIVEDITYSQDNESLSSYKENSTNPWCNF